MSGADKIEKFFKKNEGLWGKASLIKLEEARMVVQKKYNFILYEEMSQLQVSHVCQESGLSD